MLKRKKNIDILLLLIVYLSIGQSTILYAQTNSLGQSSSSTINTITTSVPFLMIAPDTRAGGLGDAGVASSPDENSVHWNASKLAFIKKDMGLGISYAPWLRALVPDINLAYLSGYKKLGKPQTIAFSVLYFSLGTIQFTNTSGQVTGQFTPHEYAVDLAYSRKLSARFSGGTAIRYIYSNLTGGIYVGGTESKPGQSVAADISAYYQNDELEIAKKKAILSFGINISNIGAKMSYSASAEKDYIPINLRLGSGFQYEIDDYNSIMFIVDLNKLLVPTPPVYETDSAGNAVYNSVTGKQQVLLGKDPNVPIAQGMLQSFYDAPYGWKEELHEITYSVGAEYWYDKQIGIRAGYFYEHATKGNRQFITLGAGVKYSVFGLDFAYLIPTTQRNPLENTLRFTLLFDFDALKAQNSEKK